MYTKKLYTKKPYNHSLGSTMDTQQAAKKFANYLQLLTNFVVVDYFDGNYNHMGATISDAILQAGLKYESVVRPRIARMRSQYPEAKTTSAFLKLLSDVGAKVVLEWSDDEKPNRVLGLAKFFLAQHVETEQELKAWLAIQSNLPNLLMVRGIGPKTVDYIKILVGSQTTAVDRHVFAILSEAGLPTTNYEQARDIVNVAGDILGIERAYFDHSIWQYMSRRQSPSTSSSSCKHSA